MKGWALAYPASGAAVTALIPTTNKMRPMSNSDEHPATRHPGTIGPLRRAQVRLDRVGPLDAYIPPTRWNGFARPHFTPEQAERFAEAFEEAFPDSTAEYDETRDQWVIDSPERDEPERWPSVRYCGQTFYPIGAGAWTWTEATDYDEIYR